MLAAQEFWRQALAGSHATSLDFYGAHERPATAEPDGDGLDPAVAAGRRAAPRSVSRSCR